MHSHKLSAPKDDIEAQVCMESSNPKTFHRALKSLFRSLSPARQRVFFPLLLLMLVGAGAEMLTVGALLPLLTVITGPESSPLLEWIRPTLNFLGAQTAREEVYALSFLFASTVMFSIITRFILLKYSNMFVFGCANEISVNIYSGTLRQSYSYHAKHSTSEIISAVNKVEIVTERVLIPLMTATVALIISTFIIFGLIIINPMAALTSAIAFAAIYVSISKVTHARLGRNGKVIATAQQSRVRSMQEGLGSIRDILIDRSQPIFVEHYATAEERLMLARARNALFANAPRLLTEGIGMIVIMLVAVFISMRQEGFVAAVPVLGAFALGAQRLLPLTQQVYQGWANSIGGKHLLFDVVDLLDRPIININKASNPIKFENSIALCGVSHSYSVRRGPALSSIDLEIPKGARVGVIGATGSGKSTLFDIIMGLTQPTHGEMKIDGTTITADNICAWQQHIAHVPQNIFLSDASITENIAFGVIKSEIDMVRVQEAAKYAKLDDVVANLPDGYDTSVGERGAQLSGGQRQRVGIARAIYKNANVLFLDEATSALDKDTEDAVIASIGSLGRNVTVIIISHRLSTLASCDLLVSLESGRITSVDSFPSSQGKASVRG